MDERGETFFMFPFLFMSWINPEVFTGGYRTDCHSLVMNKTSSFKHILTCRQTAPLTTPDELLKEQQQLEENRTEQTSLESLTGENIFMIC